MRKLKNSNDEKLRNTGSDKTQGQIASKRKNSNCDETQQKNLTKLKYQQYLKTEIGIKLKKLKL